MHAIVGRYFETMARHDWAGLRACLADRFERYGPYEEHAWADPDSYVAFLAALLPTLRGQHVEITESIHQGSGVHVNATETIEVEGAPHAVRVAATFHLDEDGRIRRVEVFTRRFSSAETGR